MKKLLNTLPAASTTVPAARLRSAVLRLALAAAAVCSAPLAHADLWAYVDDLGTTHFAADALDDRFKLYFKGDVYDSREEGLKPGQAPTEKGLKARTRTTSFFEVSPLYKSVRPHLQKAAEKTGVDYDLLKAVIAVESGFDAGAVSPKGAVGLMQLMPATAERFGVNSTPKQTVQQKLADPAVNIPAGARYLSYLMGLFPGRLDLVLAAYNAGEGAVRKAGQAIPPFEETRKYVKAVTGIYEQLQSGKLPAATRGKAVSDSFITTGRVRMTLPGVTE